MPVRLEAALLASAILAPITVLAQTAETTAASYDARVRKTFARETKSECLARMREATTEIVVCGERERKDKFRMTRGSYVLPTIAVIQSPAERFHETKALIAASQNNVGAGYTSSLTGIKKGYVRGIYKLVSPTLAGKDPYAEDE
jgi:hypothetical protein